ncbi:MAG: cytochrome c family protein [candidate division KSB1 bacterium]|nr:cytochrome c family protein [candidate division KSB1 bacterium]MDZ7275421.1 cytochrome c family protein [candidate division KSB1 bacterium]MDZ7286267.1 cytochrome c family protein [candidate division KSB1 bacterium]MDZ7296493.1 cytochrome c family protein [candidate division KSB1 bacterium]MDZ7305549.1 cytochrome c family protein [candidate division KSB1 bacterium]
MKNACLAPPLLLLLTACNNPDPVQPPAGSAPKFKVTDFATAETCQGCHPNHYAEWSTSMHAYAFTDPVFFAMNAAGQQKTGGRLDQFCTQCHSPVASLTGETPPFFDPNKLSAVSHRGVSCEVCHSLTKINQPFNAAFELKPGKVKYGSLADPAPNGFHDSQFNPLFSRSEFCGVCHEVKNPLGVMVEETFSEWNVAALAGMSFDCQDCHMPVYAGQAAVGGPLREQVHRHTFVGVDVPLVDFPGADLQRRESEKLLQNAASMQVTHPATLHAGDTLQVQVSIFNNKTGHALPSGVTAERQMWIAIRARDDNGNLLYQSGQLDANGDLMDQHSELNRNADADLTVFRQTLRGPEGGEVLFFFEASRVENNLIPFLATRTAGYRIPLAGSLRGAVHLEVRLRFRSLPPYFLRALGLGDLVAKVPIVDMAVVQRVIPLASQTE